MFYSEKQDIFYWISVWQSLRMANTNTNFRGKVCSNASYQFAICAMWLEFTDYNDWSQIEIWVQNAKCCPNSWLSSSIAENLFW